jgi:hypothetical protein
MKITESKLRSIIRKVIAENNYNDDDDIFAPLPDDGQDPTSLALSDVESQIEDIKRSDEERANNNREFLRRFGRQLTGRNISNEEINDFLNRYNENMLFNIGLDTEGNPFPDDDEFDG